MCSSDLSDSPESSETPDPTQTDQPPADRAAACYAAAGLDPNATTSDVPATGLENAIQHVLANCIKNPQAPGLITALEHLYANQQRHAAHEAEKAARQAAHDAEKAARKAAHEASHSDAGDHGNSGSHGNSGEHGNSGS